MNQSLPLRTTNWTRWLGIALILIVGAVHLIDAPGSFDDATYRS